MKQFPVTRVYADGAGETHFHEGSIPLNDAGTVGFLSDPIATEALIFREVIASYDWDFHPAPHRQFIVLLDGEIEIEVSDGEKRRFAGGDILLLEDTTGKGHRTRNVVPRTRRSLFIQIPADVVLPGFLPAQGLH